MEEVTIRYYYLMQGALEIFLAEQAKFICETANSQYLETLRDKIIDLETENKSLEEDLEDLNESANDLERERDDANKKVKELKEIVKKLKRKLKALNNPPKK